MNRAAAIQMGPTFTAYLTSSQPLIELGSGVSVADLEHALAAHGFALITDTLTGNRRIVAIPPYLRPEVVDKATEQAERGVEHLPRRDNTIVEPLRHHAHPRVRGAADFKNKRRRSNKQ